MKKILAMLLALVMVLSLAACGYQATPDANNYDASDDYSDTPAEVTYAVEAGSAGEEVANEMGWKITSVGSQADALMEVSSGTSDAAIIDLLMAGAMVGEGTSYPDLMVTDQKLTSELFGDGCRKGSDLASYINSVMSAAYADGSMLELAKTYTLASHNYMLKSAGDGMAMFQGCTLLQDSVMIDNQVLINYIVDVLGGVVGEDYADPYGQGRITVIEKK